MARKSDSVALIFKSLFGIDPTSKPKRTMKKLEKPPISPNIVTASFTMRSAI